MSKVKKQPQNELIPFPIDLSNSSIYYWFSILKNWISSSSTSRPRGIYLAYGKFVWILQEDHRLYQQGHFGKGTLSRSDPTWYSRLQQSQEMTPEQITIARRKQRRLQQQQRRTQHTSAKVPEADLSSHGSQQEEEQKRDQRSMEELMEWTQGENYERSQLDLFEAFFLVYGLDVLDIQDKDQRRLSIDDCWSLFSHAYTPATTSLQNMDHCPTLNMFAAHYAVYHYYRSQGWIPKNGLKFGVDFVLYQMGPSYRHAEFAVLVIPCTIPSTTAASTSQVSTTYRQPYTTPYTWTQLLRINRVCNQVKKTLVLCYVTLPLPFLSASWHLPILDQCTVRQVIMKRWSAGNNRD